MVWGRFAINAGNFSQAYETQEPKYTSSFNQDTKPEGEGEVIFRT